jgi:hypothetical protein
MVTSIIVFSDFSWSMRTPPDLACVVDGIAAVSRDDIHPYAGPIALADG